MLTHGVGIDIVDVIRVEMMIERKGEYALRRILTQVEREYCMSKPFPAQHIAARIAAKEATYKALQIVPRARGIGWRDMEVDRGSDGAPNITLYGLAHEVAEEIGIKLIRVSLTHTASQAAAVAMALG